MSDTTTTTQSPTAPTAQPAAPAAPEVITFTPDKLEEFKASLRREGAQQGLDERFKNWLKPDEARALKAELDSFKKSKAEKDAVEQTATEKALAARDAALNEIDKIRREAEQRVVEATTRFDAERKTSAILTAVESLRKRGIIAESVLADDVAELTAKHLTVADGKVTGKDQYERPCSVEEFLTAWVAQPTRANYRPPAPAGTGNEPGRSPGAPTVKPIESPEEGYRRLGGLKTRKPAQRQQPGQTGVVPPDGGAPR